MAATQRGEGEDGKIQDQSGRAEAGEIVSNKGVLAELDGSLDGIQDSIRVVRMEVWHKEIDGLRNLAAGYEALARFLPSRLGL